VKRSLIRATIAVILAGKALAQEAVQPTPSPVSQPTPAPGGNNNTVIDNLENALQERDQQQQAELLADPSKPRMHRFTNQPLARVFRVLAEEAQINYIEPKIPSADTISVTLSNLTPLQAFYEIAQSRGFEVVTDGTKYTLRRADYVTKEYRIRHQQAEYLLQPIANFLGIDAKAAGENFPGYPKPVAAKLPQEASSSGTVTGTDQTQPRYQPGLPFDAPLSEGGFAKDAQDAVFVERSTNSLVVRATPEEQDRIGIAISRLDKEERQILIKTYVVEVDDSNGLGGGIDWSQALGLDNGQGATFALKSVSGQAFPQNGTRSTSGSSSGIGTLTDVLGNLTPGRFFTNGLILDVNNLQIVLHGLQTKGRIKTNNSPMTVAKSGIPVTIRSVTQQTIFITTPGTNNYPPTSAPYTFTTGLTIDVVARILDSGLIDMNLNPKLSTITGQSPAESGTTTTVPIISTRSTTANVTVRSGQAAVIGGILQDGSTFNQNGIPVISKIPVLGYLFKSKLHSNQRTNLIVIVSPTIIPADNRRRDRLGESERDILEGSSDLPGEPPPVSWNGGGKKTVGGKQSVYMIAPKNGARAQGSRRASQ
jgi:type II secretory pathway component GspD/PulD (secretin)